MSKEIESISSALFDKIRSRFPNVTLGDEKAQAETDPTEARFFNFTYTGKDGAEFGTVTISLIDETSLKVYYGQNISSEMDREQRKTWYEFLRNLRMFAKRNLLTFDTRDINKSNLDLKDIKQQAKVDDVSTTKDVPMTESKLYGTSRNSYADMDQCRLLIKHEGLVSDEKRGDRTRKIKEIFIETPIGERLLVPFKNLHGARAMCRHINEGGTTHDDMAEYIINIVKEMSAMRHFVRATKNRQFEDAETAEMSQAAIQHYSELKSTLKHLHSKHHYDEFMETFVPEALEEDNIDVDALRERFVKKVYDDRFTEALPIVYKAHKRLKAQPHGQLGNELEEWADTVYEDTWTRPDSEDKIKVLQQFLQTPKAVGIDGIDALADIEQIIGDDDLHDAIYQLAQGQGPDADARGLVKTWLEHNMPDLLNQLAIGPKNVDAAHTNTPPVSPAQAHPNDTYGASSLDEPNVNESNDSLDFIRSLAGITRTR
jgi:hypothetical protein